MQTPQNESAQPSRTKNIGHIFHDVTYPPEGVKRHGSDQEQETQADENQNDTIIGLSEPSLTFDKA